MTIIKQLSKIYQGFNNRERIFVSLAGVALIFTALYFAGSFINEKIADSERMAIVRKRHLSELYNIVDRYRLLSRRLERAKTTFAKSQMTFEQVTDQLDKIVRDSIGSDKYDLKRGRNLTKIGLDYEKQDFTLKVPALDLEQVVKLLYRLEQGDSPLFLGKVDLLKSSSKHNFSATLEIFSIRKN